MEGIALIDTSFKLRLIETISGSTTFENHQFILVVFILSLIGDSPQWEAPSVNANSGNLLC